MTKELNKLSKGTLGSYIKKAKDDLENKSYYHGLNHGRDSYNAYGVEKGTKMSIKKTNKIKDRSKNINKAVNKLTKEDLNHLLNPILESRPSQFKETFDEILCEKLSEIIAEQKKNIASNIFEISMKDWEDSKEDKIIDKKIVKSINKAEKKPTNESRDNNLDTVTHYKTRDGTVSRLTRGHSFSVVLHPKHKGMIRKLPDGGEHTFRDEQNVVWHAKKDNDKIHFESGRYMLHGDHYASMKHTVKSSDALHESNQIDEISKDLINRYALKALADRPKVEAVRKNAEARKNHASSIYRKERNLGPNIEYGENQSSYEDRLNRILDRHNKAQKDETKANRKANNRNVGLWSAGKRLSKETE